MCGICGILGERDEGLIRGMTRRMTHRGPDDEGYYLGDGISLGVRRLSIIDVGGGRQPITNEDGTLVVVFNGEIYNYRDLRPRLEKQGHRFRTDSDTEVLVHLYEEYGEAGVHLLRGMFTFALWDGPRRRLLVARDRLGIKPLYYADVGGKLLFGSEAKALLVHPAVPRDIDPEALNLYLTFQYVPGPRTVWRAIRKLPSGHLLVAEGGRIEVRRYWDVTIGEFERDIDLDDAAEEFHSHFAEAVRLHLVSDVPLGVLLSGGIDSSAVTALVHAAEFRPIQTFTVGFDLPGMHNELTEARMVARHFGTEHHEVIVSPDAAALLPRLIWHLDEPVADAAALPTYLVCAFAKQHVTVVLTGEGGDELLGGYPRYAWFLVARRLQQLLPRALRERVLLPLGAALPIGPLYRRRMENLLGEWTDAERHVRWIANLGGDAKRELLTPALEGVLDQRAAEAMVERYLNGGPAGAAEIVHRLMMLDMKTWMVDDVLTKMDKMSMAASVEARVPFLDHQVVEFVTGLPSTVKVRNLGTKRLLKHVMRGQLPEATLRRRKHAFLVPVDAWLQGPLRGLVRDVLLDERVGRRGWFRPTRIRQMVANQEAGRGTSGQAVWNLLCLELWARIFLDKEEFEGVEV